MSSVRIICKKKKKETTQPIIFIQFLETTECAFLLSSSPDVLLRERHMSFNFVKWFTKQISSLRIILIFYFNGWHFVMAHSFLPFNLLYANVWFVWCMNSPNTKSDILLACWIEQCLCYFIETYETYVMPLKSSN